MYKNALLHFCENMILIGLDYNTRVVFIQLYMISSYDLFYFLLHLNGSSVFEKCFIFNKRKAEPY